MSRPFGSTHMLTHEPWVAFGTEYSNSTWKSLATLILSIGVAVGVFSLPPLPSEVSLMAVHGPPPRLAMTAAGFQDLSSKSRLCQFLSAFSETSQVSLVTMLELTPRLASRSSRSTNPAGPLVLKPCTARTCFPGPTNFKCVVISLETGVSHSLLFNTSL